jgi:hypothetical protein
MRFHQLHLIPVGAQRRLARVELVRRCDEVLDLLGRPLVMAPLRVARRQLPSRHLPIRRHGDVTAQHGVIEQTA